MGSPRVLAVKLFFLPFLRVSVVCGMFSLPLFSGHELEGRDGAFLWRGPVSLSALMTPPCLYAKLLLFVLLLPAWPACERSLTERPNKGRFPAWTLSQTGTSSGALPAAT